MCRQFVLLPNFALKLIAFQSYFHHNMIHKVKLPVFISGRMDKENIHAKTQATALKKINIISCNINGTFVK